MDTVEIFNAIAAHMIKGVEMHNNLIDLFSFLSLKGYAEQQIYQYYSENYNLLQLKQYYISHYYTLPHPEKLEAIEVIPASWLKYARADVDSTTKRQAINKSLNIWLTWEKETKLFLENHYAQLLENKDSAAASFVLQFIEDVTEEIQEVYDKIIELESINYDMIEIVKEQEAYYNQYHKKLKKVMRQ